VVGTPDVGSDTSGLPSPSLSGSQIPVKPSPSKSGSVLKTEGFVPG